MSVMDIISDRYEDQIDALKAEIAALKAERDLLYDDGVKKSKKIADLEEALVIANNTITLMASDINKLKYDNAVLTGDVDEWRRQWRLMSAAEIKAEEEVAKLKAQRDKAGSVALELEQRCAELDQELSRMKQGKEAE